MPKPPSARATMRKAEALDLRRQKQIENQIASINRLLEGATYDDEMAELHRQLAEAQATIDEMKEAH